MCDVVVVGSGAGGMAAAVTAAKSGLDVLVVEKTAYFGGSTAVSGGAVWVPNNPLMAQAGHVDSRELVTQYLRAIVGSRMRRDMMDAYLDEGPRMVEFMQANTDVKFAPRGYSPDYDSDLPGASMGGRTLDPLEFDARLLGPRFQELRRPYPQFMVLRGMMVNRKDAEQLIAAFTTMRGFVYSAGLVARYLGDRLRYARGARLLLGNALAGRLFKSALDAGVTMWSGTRARKMIAADGRILGIYAERDGNEIAIRAHRGVVLAAGGFAASSAWRERHVPGSREHFSVSPEGNTGDGLDMALEVGATLDAGNACSVFCTPISKMTLPDGSEHLFPHLVTDRQKPGLIAVNAHGRRFTDESASYHAFAQAMNKTKTVPAFLICDRTFLRKYGLGMVRPEVRGLSLVTSVRRHVRCGYLTEAASIAELAAKLDIDGDSLQQTVTNANEYARNGQDPEFGRGSLAYSRYLGDPSHLPNPCLGPIDTPPFYAVRVYPGDIGSARGLRTNAHAQVLNGNDVPIPGLYACGNDMNSVMAGTYPAAGITLGPALTFGYIAGRHLAEQRPAVHP